MSKPIFWTTKHLGLRGKLRLPEEIDIYNGPAPEISRPVNFGRRISPVADDFISSSVRGVEIAPDKEKSLPRRALNALYAENKILHRVVMELTIYKNNIPLLSQELELDESEISEMLSQGVSWLSYWMASNPS